MKNPYSTSLSGDDVATCATSQEPGPYYHGVRMLLAKAMQASSHAMIPATARQCDGRLIAMPRVRSHPVPPLQYGLFGFAESEPDCLAIKPAREGRSAKENPQVYGKAPAGAFDLEGLVTWLRRRYPRYTAVSIEAATSISAGSVENWLQYRSQPSVEHFTLLVHHYGPSILRAALKEDVEWIVKAEAEAIAAELDDEIRTLMNRRDEVLRRAGT